MQLSTVLAKLLGAFIAMIAVGLGLTTYTLPNHATGAYDSIRILIEGALGDSQPKLPGPPQSLALNSSRPGGDDTASTPFPSTVVLADSAQPVEWVTQAVQRDSAALRGWLGPGVFAFATIENGNLRTTLWRFTFSAHCPSLSRLRATSTGGANLRLLHLTGDCPRSP